MTAAAVEQWPILCLVTDHRRHRRAHSADSLEGLFAVIMDAVTAGVDLVQIREPAVPARDLVMVVRRAVAAARGSRSRIVVNDRVDCALAAGADGVHLKQSSMSADRVRSIAPRDWRVGQSVHSMSEVMALVDTGMVRHLDYLTLGAVFETTSKPGGQPVGLGVLADVARLVPIPTLAIGGVDVGRMQSVARAGAAGVAAVGGFHRAADVAALGPLVNAWRLSFRKGVAVRSRESLFG